MSGLLKKAFRRSPGSAPFAPGSQQYTGLKPPGPGDYQNITEQSTNPQRRIPGRRGRQGRRLGGMPSVMSQ